MGLISPEIGTIFWMVLGFSIVFFILRKFGWVVILKSLKEREDSIDRALQSAEKAREEMVALRADHDSLMKEARAERETILAEAKTIRVELIEKAKGEAATEADRVLENARNEIENEKRAALSEIRRQVAELSVDIAEKILRKELDKDEKQKALINELLEEMKLN
jgi:F-type H+-transporting ATPase subunit b